MLLQFLSLLWTTWCHKMAIQELMGSQAFSYCLQTLLDLRHVCTQGKDIHLCLHRTRFYVPRRCIFKRLESV